jgi:DNA-binding GntR family transcriptional regulator
MSRPLDDDSQTSVELVVSALMRGIRAGKYVPGQRLFAGDFAQSLGLSRSPIREAFHMLAGQGVLDLLPNRGVEIRRLSRKHLIDGMEILRVTGVYGLEIMVPKLDNRAAAQLRAATAAIRAAGRNRQPFEWFEQLVNFHYIINEIGGNLYLNTMWHGLHLTHFNRMLSDQLPGRHWDQYINNYELICGSLLSDHPERSIKLFEAHMRWALGLLRDGDNAAPPTSILRKNIRNQSKGP